LLTAYASSGQKRELIDLVADEGTRSAGQRALMPVEALLKGFNWPDFRDAGVGLTSPIAIYLLWDATGDDKVASWLRFATRQFLKAEGKPSALIEKRDAYRRS
jgi:hypothetical protein